MDRLEIRNSRWESGAGVVASMGFAVAGLAALAFIVHKAIVDPQARWAGEAVKAPLLGSLFLGGLGLIVSVLATAGTFYFARRFLDRRVQLLIDEDAVECRRIGRRVRWAEIADIRFNVAYERRGSVIAAGMEFLLRDGDSAVVSTFQLDVGHDAIHAEVERRWRTFGLK